MRRVEDMPLGWVNGRLPVSLKGGSETPTGMRRVEDMPLDFVGQSRAGNDWHWIALLIKQIWYSEIDSCTDMLMRPHIWCDHVTREDGADMLTYAVGGNRCSWPYHASQGLASITGDSNAELIPRHGELRLQVTNKILDTRRCIKERVDGLFALE